MSKFTDTVARNTPEDFPQLVTGWPDAEHGFTWYAYCDWAKELIDELPDGSDIGQFQTFKEWLETKREERQNQSDGDDLGFSHHSCDLCGAFPGDRYAVTALPDNPADNRDYVALSVCQDCLCYIANGDEPEDWE